MIHMLCRNRVAEYATWKAVFDSHAAAHQEAGLRLVYVWHDVKDANNVYFVFEVADIDRAQAFIDHPDSAKAGEDSGVIDGEYHFVESAEGY